MKQHSFRDTHVTFATNHGKAVAAQEPFERILASTVTPLTIDSDSLGTFSGEIERPGSMIDALRGKVLLARALTKDRFVLVSEGSFGSADGFGFVVHGIEMLMLHDAETGAEVLEQHISYETNYATATPSTIEDLRRFMDRISCGTHGLVLYPDGSLLPANVSKGITDRSSAEHEFARLQNLSPSRAVVAMSDMRAHVNPTRMRAIKSCCELLALRLATPCPTCRSGGFGLTATVAGLPCEECGSPTQRARGEKHSCPFCNYALERPRSDGKRTATAAECDWCNP